VTGSSMLSKLVNNLNPVATAPGSDFVFSLFKTLQENL